MLDAMRRTKIYLGGESKIGKKIFLRQHLFVRYIQPYFVDGNYHAVFRVYFRKFGITSVRYLLPFGVLRCLSLFVIDIHFGAHLCMIFRILFFCPVVAP